MRKIIIYLILILSTMILLSCSRVNTAEDIYSLNLESIVEVKVEYDENISYATAVCINNNSTFISNAHIVPSDDSLGLLIFIRFTTQDEYIEVEIINIDRTKDLLLLKSIDEIECKPLNFSTDVKTGQEVFAVGNTSNQGISISKGIVTKKEVYIKTTNISMNMIATDAFFADGNSGGALVDINNNLLGITTLRLKDSSGNIIYGVDYVIPISVIIEFINGNL